MRKTIAVFMLAFFPLNAWAAATNDAEDMGHLAGAVMACGAHRSLYQFEEIVSRYFSNTAPNEEAEKAQLRIYAQAKASTFSVYRNRTSDCPETIRDFIRMPIFSAELYSDGSLKMPDGKFLYPRGQTGLAQDAELIYPE